MTERNLPVPTGSRLPAKNIPPKPAESALAGILSPATRKAYTRDVLTFFGAKDLSEITMEDFIAVTPDQVAQFRDRLMAEGKSPATVSRYLSALRKTFRYLMARRVIEFNPVDTQIVNAPKQVASRKRERMTPEDVERMLGAIDQRKEIGKRDYAMILLAIRTGMRRSELCGLTEAAIDRSGKVVMLDIVGKGQKERRVPVPKDVWPVVEEWMKVKPRGEWIFTSIRGDRMKEHAFWKVVQKYAKKAGIDRNPDGSRRSIHPHAFRAACITFLLRAGVPIHEVQQMMGHSRGETTLGYVRELALEESAAVEALDGLGTKGGRK